MLVRAVAVTMNQTLSLQDLNEGFEFKIASRRDRQFFLAKIVPLLLVIARTSEGIPDHFHRTHSGSRISLRLPRLRLEIRALYVLAQCELDPRRCSIDREIFSRMAVFEFDRDALSADRIRRSMQKQAPGNAACKGTIYRDVLWIEHVPNTSH